MLFDCSNIPLGELISPLLIKKKVEMVMVRLDKIHPVVSGNKLFKLHHFLEEALKEPKKKIITFGGAYSNHLVATAFACKEAGLECCGMVRGEKPPVFSHSLNACLEFGMELKFISREEYAAVCQGELNDWKSITVPEGGYSAIGAAGASLIVGLLKGQHITHICTAVGTATTLAGILLKAEKSQTVIAVPVLKGFTDIPERLQLLTGKNRYNNLVILDDYHFGGYAKKTDELIAFMNELYKNYQLPTDIVYTAKMMYAVMDRVKKGYFAEGSRIACLHTGGLQGNHSLPEGSLFF